MERSIQISVMLFELKRVLYTIPYYTIELSTVQFMCYTYNTLIAGGDHVILYSKIVC